MSGVDERFFTMINDSLWLMKYLVDEVYEMKKLVDDPHIEVLLGRVLKNFENSVDLLNDARYRAYKISGVKDFRKINQELDRSVFGRAIRIVDEG